MNNKYIYTNHLIKETSPYLLQHAHNPVDWYAWGDAAFEKAKKEDKLVLVSIGYSSCHWCHVMEHESFEDTAVAKIMNEHFVCIKVDREERPDIDQVYMSAVQLMKGQGGWPLNCFTLPDGKPVYGGTYFPKEQWKDMLMQLSNFYKNNKAKAIQYAEELTQGIQSAEVVKLNEEEISFSPDDVKNIIEPWKKYFDNIEGGPNHAPKFPLPNNYEFLLRYYAATKDKSILDHVLLTLNKMAYGGIYDQIGGGFARYSTDSLWKVPHFEKMLYDNAQLVSIYSMAYQLTKDELYKNIVYETLGFISREMTSAEGGFYSALDADSEGKEGKYYVWKKEELSHILSKEENFKIFCEYFNVNEKGYWEEDNYILLRKKTDQQIAQELSISVDDLKKLISESKAVLLKEREKRIHPGLDDKQLTSWNALMIKGYCDAYNVFGEKRFLEAAIKNAAHLLSKVKQPDGAIYHSYKDGRTTINGYLEDYSFMCEALIALYQSTFDERWLNEAKQLADYIILHFLDKDTQLFWFTSDRDPALIARKKEINDNVIPASNSSMAKALFYLSVYFDNENYAALAKQMLSNVKNSMSAYGSGYSNWGILILHYAFPFYEVVIAGKEADKKRIELNQQFIPNKIIAGSSNNNSKLSLLAQRYIENKTLIYICENRACKLPVESTEDALKLIR